MTGMDDAPLDAETIGAWLDGELDMAAGAAIARRVARDPAAQALAAAIAAQGALLRSGFAAKLAEPVPPGLAAPLRRPAAPAGWRRPLAIAATLLAIAVIAAIGFAVLDWRIERRIDAAIAAERSALAAATQKALETLVSGQSADWESGATGARGRIQPVRTFRNEAGLWCREYIETVTRGGREEQARVVACRAPEGEWRPATRLPAERGS